MNNIGSEVKDYDGWRNILDEGGVDKFSSEFATKVQRKVESVTIFLGGIEAVMDPMLKIISLVNRTMVL